MSSDLAALHDEFARVGLAETDLDPSPLRMIDRWLRVAVEAGHPEPTAMTLATVTPEGDPAARVVLLKGVEADETEPWRGLVFYTNYDSDKGQDLARTPRASAALFWVHLARQIRVRGSVAKVSREESEAYFRTRARASQLGAWASKQSSVLAGRAELDARLAEVTGRFEGAEVPCPPFWGGYRLTPDRIELWQGRPSRLHDRLRYTQTTPGSWKIERLSP
jgi:pyridoxamine 5'-phosphate oxidase